MLVVVEGVYIIYVCAVSIARIQSYDMYSVR